MSNQLAAAMTTALGVISSFRGEAITYCATLSGSYLPLTGWVFHEDRPTPPAFDEQSQAGQEAKTATLKGPLTPVMVRGYFVKDTAGRTWAVEGVGGQDQQVCALARTKVTTRGPDRGGVA